jgi:phosphoglycerate dehydrogenase-like enzyme
MDLGTIRSDRETLLVLGRPGESLVAKLEAATPEMNLVVADGPEAFGPAALSVTVVLVRAASAELLRDVLLMCPNVRWVHCSWAGLDRVLSQELVESPAILTNGRGVFSSSLGEWVLGAILYFAKDFRRLVRNQGEGRWEPFEVASVAGRTVGIVGYGDIGRAVARCVRPMGMRVLGLTRRGPVAGQADDLAQEVFGPDDRIRMIEQCDYLVITAPLTPETRGMVGAAELAAMRPGAVLINVGRGPVIDEEALVEALSRNEIRGAALDVFQREPLPQGHPLYHLENVLLSPHSADRTPGWLDEAMQLFLDNLGRYDKGQALVNVVAKERGY